MSRQPLPLIEGDEVRIISPSDILDPDDIKKKQAIIDGFTGIGLKVSFGKNAFNKNASIQDKLSDLHDAFSQPEVKAIVAGTGGFSANALIDQIDYKLIKSNPKIFMGYSDITILLNAIYSRTGLITYHGPNAGALGDKHGQDFAISYIRKCLFSKQIFDASKSETWFDKDYTQTNPKYKSYSNDGWWNVNPAGIVEGRLVGGNLSCMSLLAGTKFFPKLSKSILLIEDDYETQAHHFAAKLRHLALQPGFSKIEGVIVGRFQPKSQIKQAQFKKILLEIIQLEDVPILANIDVGHTKPQLTLPIGGIVQLTALKKRQSIRVIEH